MTTGAWYRGFHLERIGWDDLWTVTDPGGSVLPLVAPTWNQAITEVDRLATEPAPSRVTCCICGHIEVPHFDHGMNSKLLAQALCFYCDFWLERLQKHQNNPNSAIIKNHAYMIHPDEGRNRNWSGFAGREFNIAFNDGRKVVTHNLWHQGDIPERFQPLIPNNAQFV